MMNLLSLFVASIISVATTSAVAANIIHSGSSPKVKILVYGDYQCPFTAKMMTTIDQMRAEYGDQIAIYFSHFPLSFHDQAVSASVAAICADRQGLFWEYSKSLLQNQSQLSESYYPQLADSLRIQDRNAFAACLKEPAVKSQVELEYLVGEAHGIGGTPSTWVNGELVRGAYPYSHYKDIIDRELAK